MRTPPPSPTAADVLAAVRRSWLPAADTVQYVPRGFGAHHWQVAGPGDGPGLFVTLDPARAGRDLRSFAEAYRATAALAAGGTPGILASLPTRTDGVFVTPLGDGVLSATPWCEGHNPTPEEARGPRHLAGLREIVAALHASPVPEGIPVWAPPYGVLGVHRILDRAGSTWDEGPYGERARAAILAAGEGLVAAAGRFESLRDSARSRRADWVPTHGEVHDRNQMVTPDGILLVDWESLALAPPERDSRDLPPHARAGLGEDPRMHEMFALEWTLSELEEYARWFSGPHGDTEDDGIALRGLEGELAPLIG